MGQLRLRGSVWWIRYYRNGRRFEETSGSEHRDDAKRLLKLREGEIAKGVPVSAKIGQLRFDHAAKDLLTDYEINGKRSAKNLRTTIIEGALAPWFGTRRMATVTTADIREYIAHRQEQGFANATINRELSALKRMYSLAIQSGKLMHRPYIPMLAEHNVRQGFFERAQFEAVRRHLAPTYQALVTIAYYTGWRVNSELLPLEWRQVDRQACAMRLEPGTTKNREGRLFLYGDVDEVRAAIEGLWLRHQALERDGVITPLVFCRRVVRRFIRSGNAGAPPANSPAVRVASRMTSAGRPCGI